MRAIPITPSMKCEMSYGLEGAKVQKSNIKVNEMEIPATNSASVDQEAKSSKFNKKLYVLY